jgi:CubicO group peptidase (beta-lactamase class C family)
MFELNSNTLVSIKKACKRKKYIKLTVGYIFDNNKIVKVFNENGEIQNENHIYEIASITKTFTASLLAKCIHENKISLDDSIKNYFIGLDANKYYPTLKRLATHTAGYSLALPFTWREYLGTPFNGYPPLKNIDVIKKLLQKNQRQDKDYPWVYSNYGFVLLGHAIGQVSGNGYWNAMDDFLSNELGLKNTYTGTNPIKNLHGYNKKNQDCGNYLFDKNPNIPSGEGDISATAGDLLTYAEMNIHEKKPYLSLCHKKYADAASLMANFLRLAAGVEKFDMGLAWMINRHDNSIMWHSGDSDSFSSYLVFNKAKKTAAVVLSNYKMDTIKIGLSIMESLE